MLPDDRRGYVPTIRGTARSNAAVSVYQRGFLVYETTVAPGPFAIEDLGAASYGGDLTVRVTEADGQAWSFIVPFATTVDLLRPGETRYSVSVGQAMASGYRSSGQRVFEAVVRTGLSDLITGYGGLAFSDYYRSVLAGAALNTRLGAFSGDVTIARASLPGERASGSSYRISYSKNLPNSGTNFSLLAYRYSTSGFVGLNEAIALRDVPHIGGYGNLGRLRHRMDASVNQDLGDKGSMYLNGSVVQYWNRPGNALNYSMGYRNHWGRVSYALSLQRVLDLSAGGALYTPGRGRSTVVTLNLSIPLGGRSSMNAPMFSSYTSHSNVSGTDTAASVAGALGDSGRLNYSLSASRSSRDAAAAASGSLDYGGTVASVGASVSQGSGYRQAGLRAQGGVLAHRGGVTLSSSLGETVGLVRAPDAEDARIGTDRGSRVDGRGYGLAANLAPYRLNTVELDPADMADDVELLASSRSVAPRAGAVVLLDYPTRRARPVLVSVRQSDGGVLPFGAEVFDLASGESVGAVGQGSRIVMRVREDQGEIRVQWGPDAAQRCRVGYRLPPRQGRQDGFDMLDAVCEPEPEPPPPAVGSPVAGLSP
ncbi:Outer membrane usher protein HtrE [compost metagenome]